MRAVLPAAPAGGPVLQRTTTPRPPEQPTPEQRTPVRTGTAWTARSRTQDQSAALSCRCCRGRCCCCVRCRQPWPAKIRFLPSWWRPIRCPTGCPPNTRPPAARPVPRRCFRVLRRRGLRAVPAASLRAAGRARQQACSWHCFQRSGPGTARTAPGAATSTADPPRKDRPAGVGGIAAAAGHRHPAGGSGCAADSVRQRPRVRMQRPRNRGPALPVTQQAQRLPLAAPELQQLFQRLFRRLFHGPQKRAKKKKPAKKPVMPEPFPAERRVVAGTEPGPSRKPAPGLTGYLLLGPTHPPNCHAPR